jgi:hypothetical protein
VFSYVFDSVLVNGIMRILVGEVESVLGVAGVSYDDAHPAVDGTQADVIRMTLHECAF